jgi:hypothetical protein
VRDGEGVRGVGRVTNVPAQQPLGLAGERKRPFGLAQTGEHLRFLGEEKALIGRGIAEPEQVAGAPEVGPCLFVAAGVVQDLRGEHRGSSALE